MSLLRTVPAKQRSTSDVEFPVRGSAPVYPSLRIQPAACDDSKTQCQCLLKNSGLPPAPPPVTLLLWPFASLLRQPARESCATFVPLREPTPSPSIPCPICPAFLLLKKPAPLLLTTLASKLFTTPNSLKVKLSW